MEVLEESQVILIQMYLATFSTVILFYDHVLTFEKEVTYVWTKPWIRSSTLFILNRYLAFFGGVVTLVLSHTTALDPRACHSYILWHQLMLVTGQVLVCIIVSLRIYALFACSKSIMWFLVLFGVVLVAVSIWSMTNQEQIIRQHGSADECHISISYDSSIRLSFCWIALFLYDSVLFGLTMYKTWKSKLYRSLSTSGSVPLLTLLLRDGAVYFMLMALVNMSNILTFYFAPPFLRGGLSTFSASLSATLVSRMMLNLHCAHSEQGVMSTVSGLMFANSDYHGPLDTMVEVELPLGSGRGSPTPRRIFMASS